MYSGQDRKIKRKSETGGGTKTWEENRLVVEKKAEKALKSKNMGEKGEGGSESSQGKKD